MRNAVRGSAAQDTKDATVRLQHCRKLYNINHKNVQKQLKENEAKHVHDGAHDATNNILGLES